MKPRFWEHYAAFWRNSRPAAWFLLVVFCGFVAFDIVSDLAQQGHFPPTPLVIRRLAGTLLGAFLASVLIVINARMKRPGPEEDC